MVDTRVPYSVVPADILRDLGIAPQNKRRCRMPGGAPVELPSARPRVTLNGKSGRPVVLFGKDSGQVVIVEAEPGLIDIVDDFCNR